MSTRLFQVASVNNSLPRGKEERKLKGEKGNGQKEQLCSSTMILRVRSCVEGSDLRQYVRGSGVGEGVKEGEEMGEGEGTGDGRYRATSVRINKGCGRVSQVRPAASPCARVCVRHATGHTLLSWGSS